jgi:hypothetical protein
MSMRIDVGFKRGEVAKYLILFEQLYFATILGLSMKIWGFLGLNKIIASVDLRAY